MDKRGKIGGEEEARLKLADQLKTYKVHLARLLTDWRQGKSHDFLPSLFLGSGKREGEVGDPLETVENLIDRKRGWDIGWKIGFDRWPRTHPEFNFISVTEFFLQFLFPPLNLSIPLLSYFYQSLLLLNFINSFSSLNLSIPFCNKEEKEFIKIRKSRNW